RSRSVQPFAVESEPFGAPGGQGIEYSPASVRARRMPGPEAGPELEMAHHVNRRVRSKGRAQRGLAAVIEARQEDGRGLLHGRRMTGTVHPTRTTSAGREPRVRTTWIT